MYLLDSLIAVHYTKLWSDDIWPSQGMGVRNQCCMATTGELNGKQSHCTVPQVAVTWMNDIKSKCGRFNAHVISWAEKNAEISGKCTVHDGRTHWWRRKGQCSSMSRLSEPWVDKCYVLWCPPFHMFSHDSQLVHVDEWWEPPGVNMMTEEMWQKRTSSCQLAARLWWSPTTAVY